MKDDSQTWAAKANALKAAPRRGRPEQVEAFLRELKNICSQREHGARILRHLLDNEVLHGLEWRERTLRAEAVELMLNLGYPHALEVRPEDLRHLKSDRKRRSLIRVGRFAVGTAAMGLLAWVALTCVQIF